MISLRDITKTYGSHVIFDHFNLDIPQGDFLALMGKSGSVKTTLLNMMGLLEQPDSGIVTICDIENPKLDSRIGRMLLRNHISYLFQNYGLVEDSTVEFNIKIAAKYSCLRKERSISDIITYALNVVGLSGLEKKKIYQLSGGEQQKVAIARLIAKPTDIILADEPTGSLDADNRDMIMTILQKLNQQGKTIIMVTHDGQAAKFAKRISEISH